MTDALIAELSECAESVARSVLRGLRDRQVSTTIDIDDLAQVAREGLLQALKEYDPTRGGRDPRPFLVERMKFAAIDYLRSQGPHGRVREDGTSTDRTAQSLDAPLGEDGGSLYDVLEGGDHELPDADSETLTAALATLSERERLVFGRHLNARSQEEIAAELGVTASRVSQIEQRARRKLRSFLASKEPGVRGRALAARELEELQLAADGLSLVKIALASGVEVSTVKTRRKRITAKLGAKNMNNAIALGFRAGLLH